jgi:hypothetical protein
MNPFRRFIRRFREPLGFPLGRHIPVNPADHAEDFAHRYAEPLDWQACIRMEELGIPDDRIGSSDRGHGVERCAFKPPLPSPIREPIARFVESVLQLRARHRLQNPGCGQLMVGRQPALLVFRAPSLDLEPEYGDRVLG